MLWFKVDVTQVGLGEMKEYPELGELSFFLDRSKALLVAMIPPPSSLSATPANGGSGNCPHHQIFQRRTSTSENLLTIFVSSLTLSVPACGECARELLTILSGREPHH